MLYLFLFLFFNLNFLAQRVLTDGNDEEHLSRGVYDTYTNTNLR